MKKTAMLVATLMLIAWAAVVSAQYNPGGTQHVSRMTLDTSKYPEERRRLIPYFPRLGKGYEVLLPSTDEFLAFQHVWGDYKRKADLKKGPESKPLLYLDRAFAKSGYEPLSRFDTSLETGKQKAVVFCTLTPDGRIDKIKSAALQEPDGSWTMKIGKLSLIRFTSLEQIRSKTYGVATSVYVRDRPVAPRRAGPPAPNFDPSILEIRR